MPRQTINPLIAAAAAPLYAAPTAWGYDAVNSNNRRKSPTGINRSEDAELYPAERARLISAGRDLQRNFALLGWAVRKHLDYVSTFTFQAKTGDQRKDIYLEAWLSNWSKKNNFDIARRNNLPRFVRLAEQRRVIDGDVFLYKLDTGHVQAIEADRIRLPNHNAVPDLPAGLTVIHGVAVNDYGAAEAYALNRRTGTNAWGQGGGTFEFERLLPAQHVYHHAYFDRFDQTRGISPLAGVYNALRDLYESFDYALAKMKVSQLLGLIFYREQADAVGDTTEETDETGATKYKVDFGKNVFKLELEPGDRAEFLESKNPSSEFQQFSQTMVSLTLKAFDIPFSFYDESFSNYSGSRQALLQYEQSAENRRAENRELLDDLTAWRLAIAIQQRDPLLAGITLDDLRWEWVAAALPWIDPMKEVSANSAAVDRGFTSTPAVCKQQGTDAFEIARDQAQYELKVREYRTSLGLPPLPASNPVTYTELTTGANNAAA